MKFHKEQTVAEHIFDARAGNAILSGFCGDCAAEVQSLTDRLIDRREFALRDYHGVIVTDATVTTRTGEYGFEGFTFEAKSALRGLGETIEITIDLRIVYEKLKSGTLLRVMKCTISGALHNLRSGKNQIFDASFEGDI